MTERKSEISVFDADNHLYETTEAFTKFLPKEYKDIIRFVEIDGRTRICIRDQISNYIPNPTFDVIAAPGAQEEFFKQGNPEGKSRRELMGDPIRSIPAFREPSPRLALMDQQGIDQALIWPTLASLIEERLRDDPFAMHAVIHAFNQWLFEQWSFNYEQRIFTAPIVTLPIVERAIDELEWVISKGARVILIRPAPVPGFMGPRSMALPEFDPFWERVAEAKILVGMHSSDSGYQKYLNEWEGTRRGEFRPFASASGFSTILHGTHRVIEDTMASLIGHGLCTRFPNLAIAPIENGSSWVGPLLQWMDQAYRDAPQVFEENPTDVFRRNIYVHPFHEDNPAQLVELVGADHVLFGSDFPHPEGLADPLSFVDELSRLDGDEIAKVMGGNLRRLIGV